MHVFKLLFYVFVTFSTLLLQAEEPLPDNWQVRLGAYLVSDQNTEFKLSENGVGAVINLQDVLGMETRAQVFRLDGYYRFTPKHSVEFSWYSINSSGYTDQTFQWGDENISSNGTLDTFFDTDIYKVNYVYSFYHNRDVELGLSAGLHVMRINVGFNGNYSVDGNLSDSSQKETALTAPLPVVGFRVGYNILPSLRVNYSADYFFITYDEYKGGLIDSLMTLDWRITRHFGTGIGYNSTRMRLTGDLGGGREVLVNHDVSGVVIYGTLTY